MGAIIVWIGHHIGKRGAGHTLIAGLRPYLARGEDEVARGVRKSRTTGTRCSPWVKKATEKPDMGLSGRHSHGSR